MTLPASSGKKDAKKSPMGKAGGQAVPPDMKRKPAAMGVFSRANSDGNLATRERPDRRPKKRGLCFITEACVRARGLSEDCYELSLLRLFRREYVEKLPEGEEVLAEYALKAPKIVAAIDALSPEGAYPVWEHLFRNGVRRSVALITNGLWDEAYAVYREMCRELEARFLLGLGRGPEHQPMEPADA